MWNDNVNKIHETAQQTLRELKRKTKEYLICWSKEVENLAKDK